MPQPSSLYDLIRKKKKTAQENDFKEIMLQQTEYKSLVNIEKRNKNIADARLKEVTDMLNAKTSHQEKEDQREDLAIKISKILKEKTPGGQISYKIYEYGQCITYLDIIKFEKIGRVKISQGRNANITLCFEKFDLNGSRYIKLYTHQELMRNNKKNKKLIIDDFSAHIFNKYLA
jgi:hypothetical protein